MHVHRTVMPKCGSEAPKVRSEENMQLDIQVFEAKEK